MRFLNVFGLILFAVLALDMSWYESKAEYQQQPPNPTEQAKAYDDTSSHERVPDETRQNQLKKQPNTETLDVFVKILYILAGIVHFIGFLSLINRDSEMFLGIFLTGFAFVLDLFAGFLSLAY